MQLKTCLAGTKNNDAVLRHFIIDATLAAVVRWQKKQCRRYSECFFRDRQGQIADFLFADQQFTQAGGK